MVDLTAASACAQAESETAAPRPWILEIPGSVYFRLLEEGENLISHAELRNMIYDFAIENDIEVLK